MSLLKIQNPRKAKMARNKVLQNKKACRHLPTGFFVPLYFLAVMLGFSSCDSVGSTGGAAGHIMPNVNGTAGEVLVVMDDYSWEHEAGEIIQDILKEEIVGLPQSEPLFDVIQITPGSFQNAFQFHRSIVLTTVGSGKEAKISFRENVWAKPQIVVQMQASSAEALRDLIREQESRLQAFLVQYDRKRQIENYQKTKDEGIQNLMTKHHQIKLAIPRGYNLDFSKDEYSSVSIESSELSQVIQVYDYPVAGPEDLSTEKLIEKRNEMTQKYVIGPREGSYMRISGLFPPVAYDLVIDGLQVVELRGLWELENGYMGGPFISHAMYDAARGRIVVVDGYIYYPNQKKRVKLKQLEAIVYSTELI
ncbi:MAG: hypothetical protein CSA96_10580 [Bacteroidetes bacterium]|nr:MAG: hypothetical protein CSA96_10580 [Bacteroidota bacterium]